jgi:hypothetical protein
MATIVDLMSSVYDMLAKQLGSAGTGSYLQFGWPGICLSSADFKPFNNPSGPYDAAVAEEMLSAVANIAPVCSAAKFENSGFELDDLYQILIVGAVPLGADPNNLINSPAFKLFSDAQFEFVSAQKGSTRDPSRFYYPCRATPSDWYTEDNAKNWLTLSVSSSQIKPAKPDSPFVKFGGKKLVDLGVLNIAPTDDKALIRSKLQIGVDQKIEKFETRLPTTMSTNVRPLDKGKLFAKADFASTQPVARATTNVKTMAVANAKLRPRFAIVRLDKNAVPDVDPKRFEVVAAKNISFGERLYLNHVLTEQLVPKPIATTTEGFNISFKFCLVTLDRSWLKSALLNTRNWYMFGTKAGEYSQGRIDNNTGMFPMLPSAFVAIRDLTITANWSQQDAQTVAQSKSFGPFDVRNGTFNQGSLVAKQLQIIGWLSRLTPTLPPQEAPATP